MSGWSPLDLLPGAWVALLALSLAAALRRWFDPAPARAWTVWGAVLSLLFAPSLVGGRSQLPLGCLVEVAPYMALTGDARPPGNLFQGDLVFQIAPWLERVRAAYAAGEWPLWNHLAGAGEPLLGNPQSQALQPLALLAIPFPVVTAAGVLCALRVLLALVFSFLWMRRQGLGETASLAGSLAFGLGGFLQLWMGWPLAGTAAWLPLALYALTRVDEVGARRDRLLLALGLFGLLVVGHPESTLHALALAAAFGLSRLAARPRGRRFPLLRAWALSGAVAAGLAAPVALPAASALPQGQRSVLLAARHARLAAERPLAPWRDPQRRRQELRESGRRLLPVAAPNAFGNNRFGRYWGPHNVLDDAAGFTGAAVLLVALTGLASPRGGRRLPGERLMLGAALVCLVVLARPPGLVHVLDALPVLRESLQFHDRIALVLNLALAFLAACAWERARRGELRHAPLVAAAVVLAALLAWGYLGHPDPADPGALAGLRRATLAVQLAAVVLAAAALAMTARGRLRTEGSPHHEAVSAHPPAEEQQPQSHRKAGVVLTEEPRGGTNELAYGTRPLSPPERGEVSGQDPLRSSSTPKSLAPARGDIANRSAQLGTQSREAAACSSSREGNRLHRAAGWAFTVTVAGELLFVHLPANPATPRELYYPRLPPIAHVSTHLAPGERMAGAGSAMRPNVATVYGLPDARSTNPLKPAAYLEAISRLVRFPNRVADGFADPADPLWDLLGIRYVITPPRMRLPPPIELDLRRATARVYRRPDALPRLFLPAAAISCPGPGWAPCLAGIRDFAALAAVRELPPGAPMERDRPGATALQIVEVASTRISASLAGGPPPLRASPDRTSLLLASSVYQDGGWRLLADGRPVPTILANGPLVAAWLSPEARRLDLLYRPPGFLAGMALAAVALAAGLAFWTAPPRGRRPWSPAP